MSLKYKYIKCFSKEKSDQLLKAGFVFLYEQNGVYYHENNDKVTAKFSNDDIFQDTKFSFGITF